MHADAYPSPSNPQISLPRLSFLGRPPALTVPPRVDPDQSIEPIARATQPAVIMVGLDEKGKPHASQFAADQADATAVAAKLMGMAVVEVTSDLATVAMALPQGKLFESGKAFVPFVKRSTYDLLAAHLSEDYLAAAAQRVHAAASAGNAKASTGEIAPRNHPEHWSKITVDDVVLASEGHDDGWWEATVTVVQEGDNYLLSWTDWPELDQFTRHVTQLALLHPKFTTGAPE